MASSAPNGWWSTWHRLVMILLLWSVRGRRWALVVTSGSRGTLTKVHLLLGMRLTSPSPSQPMGLWCDFWKKFKE